MQTSVIPSETARELLSTLSPPDIFNEMRSTERQTIREPACLPPPRACFPLWEVFASGAVTL